MKQLLTSIFTVGFCAIASASYAGSLQSSLSVYDADDCTPVVEAHLTEHAIDREKIKVIDYITHNLQAGGRGQEKEYQAWVSFSTCKGNMVIRLDRQCYIEQTYNTYECKNDGLPTK